MLRLGIERGTTTRDDAMRLRGLLIICCCAALAGCGASRAARAPVSEQDAFWASLMNLCGKAYPGTLVQGSAADSSFRGVPLVMHVRLCSDSEIQIPFTVGENRSRTWIIYRTETGLRLKHDHRHEDGSEDALTMYGGDTVDGGTVQRQTFPVDDESKALFTREKREVSLTNVWAMEIEPGRRFVYELARPDRLFRVEFDLSRPVPAPPPPWGAH